MRGLERGVVMSMRYKLLGRTGLRVSELCLGAMIFGDSRGAWGASRNEAARIVERFAEAGGNFVQQDLQGRAADPSQPVDGGSWHLRSPPRCRVF
jgi:hypothetical protein